MPVNTKRKPKDDEESVMSEVKQPFKNFQALMGEGEKFFRDQLYIKAIECYTEALELNPGNKNALVERAACYLKLGKNELALQDAEESLKDNKEFTKGLYEKAEALYAMGEFELALVYFHRGKKIRSDVKEFQLGINKAQEAIDNCVGDPNTVKLEVKGDLSYFEKPDEKQKKPQKLGGYSKPIMQKQQTINKREKRSKNSSTQKTVRQLLGELYADKVYLEQLLEDDVTTKANTKTGDAIYQLVNSGLNFLDSRTEFWRQQKPIYARKAASHNRTSSFPKDPTSYIFQQLEIIDNLQNNRKYSESLQKCESLLNYVNKLNDRSNNDKFRITSNVYSNMGNAYLELGKYDFALESHNRDLQLSESNDNTEDVSRALENLGRVYARSGRFKEAIEVWEKKLPLVASHMEKAWLYHEIGRCYLELGNCERAKEYGRESYQAAKEINDDIWQLNATVLIAQSDAKLGDIDSLIDAIESFDIALKMISKQKNQSAEHAIIKARNYCKEKLKKLETNINSSLVDYKIEIINSKANDSDSKNASLISEIYGTRGTIGPIELVNNDSTSEESKVFEFTQLKDIGRIKKMSLRCEPNGQSSVWKIDSIHVTKNSEVKYLFCINKEFNQSVKVNLDVEPDKKLIMVSEKESGKTMKSKIVKEKIPEKELQPIDPNETSPRKSKTPEHEPIRSEQQEIENLKTIVTPTIEQEKTDDNEAKQMYTEPEPEPTQASYELEAQEDTNLENEQIVDSVLHKEENHVTNYKVTVTTGDKIAAGTDSNIFIIIYGENGCTEKLHLNKPNKDPFERGATDIFQLNANDVGTINKINISHDGVGIGSGWYCDSIEISVEERSETYKFPVDRWLDEDEDDGKTSIDVNCQPI